ncbi:LTA synthase family protein [Butyrivibrio sp. AE3006]|uniref:LTA synthase family protein n=1 Tax=Butyrivibrio sp. AE3006 TaxID=1280673 RepID=UPI00042615A2|nr:LTA synthase family protein [Butyrivibrio sp. AE3006]
MGKKKKLVFRNIPVTLIMTIPFLLFFTAWWFFHTWSTMTVNELVFNIKMSMSGASHAMIKLFLMEALLPTIVAGIILYLIISFAGNKVFGGKKRLILILVDIAVLIAAIAYTWVMLDMTKYIEQQINASKFIEENYVNPNDVTLEFPVKKRNLIYVYLESVEVTDADKENGGSFEKSRIPELTQLSHENENFSGDNKTLDGGFSMPGTDWTMGAIFAQSSGLPLQIRIEANSMSSQEKFFPSVCAIGDILEAEGYHNEFVCGSEAGFGGRELFFKSHGNYDICDYPYAKEQGWIPQDYGVWWGYEDEKLFEFSKKRLEELSKSDDPFNLTIITADTHFEDGYVCRLCENEFEDQYSNVYACSSRQVTEFVKWIKEQDFYENTTVVLVGDHPTMDADFCAMIDEDYVRRVYTCYLNADASVQQTGKRREYTTFDMFPTTLAAMGVKIEGDRLGLGTNLFSSEDTLLEKYGMEHEFEELSRRSAFMDELAEMDEYDIAMQNYSDPTAAADISIEDDGTVRIVVSDIQNVNEQITSVELNCVPDGDSSRKIVLNMDKQPDGSYVSEVSLADIDVDDTDFNIYVNSALGSRWQVFAQRGDMNLKQTDFAEYLSAIEDYLETGNYTVLISTRKNATARLTKDNIAALNEIGITDDIVSGEDMTIVAALSKDSSESHVTKDYVEITGTIPNGTTYLVKGSWNGSDEGSFGIIVDDTDRMIQRKGLHFAVINNQTGRVIDCVDFDLIDGETRR